MQGTIAGFDPDAHTGTLLLDDGTELEFGPDAFAASGLRLLRLGQRVVIESTAAGGVTSVSIPGIKPN
jgi:hypothetical protein